MSTEPFDRLERLFRAARMHPPEEREAFLAVACADDPMLRAEIESLLRHDAAAEAEAFLDDAPTTWAPAPGATVASSGERIGGYEVLERIGSGGMGLVYRARDVRLGRHVALKFLPVHLSTHEETKQRFLREARVASALDHPNICTIYEVGEAPAPPGGTPRLFLAMACYEGETLKEKIDRGPLAIAEALGVAVQVAEGLTRAHARGIVHRDVKPSNLMVTNDGLVKILDFGIAKVADAQLTRTGATLGTVAYMSPEQARGAAVDHRTDIWSLGVVLYEMLTGQRPFRGEGEQAVLYGVLHLSADPVGSLRDGIPLQLTHLVEKALAKAPADRYQHMHEMLAELKAVQTRSAARSSAEKAVLDTPAHAGEAASAPPPVEGPSPLKMLVVDDEPEVELLIRRRMRHQIRDEAWSFVFATDGQDALAKLAADPTIAMVITDLNMPRMDGLTLLARLNEMDRPLRTVVVSAYGDMANIRAAMNQGAFDFLTKPIDFDDLEQTIRKTHRDLTVSLKAAASQRRLVWLQKEMELTRRMQEALLPMSFPRRADLDVYAFTTPAHEVSGTFYDVFEVGKHQIGFVVGDVGGKGVAAAVSMAMSQTFLRSMALRGEPPGACLTAMNQLLFPEGFPGRAVSVFYGVLETDTGKLRYSSAAFSGPYVLRPEGSLTPLASALGPPVWQQPGHGYHTEETRLLPEEGLFLCTRGITESVDQRGHAFGVDRLAALLKDRHGTAPAQLIRDVLRAVLHFTEGTDLTDDLTVMALRYAGETPDGGTPVSNTGA